MTELESYIAESSHEKGFIEGYNECYDDCYRTHSEAYNEALDDIQKSISGASIYYRFSKEELIKLIDNLRK